MRGGLPGEPPDDPTRKAINLEPLEPQLTTQRSNIAFFETLPFNDRSRVDFGTVRGTQFLQPLFEFSGACAGCGETPYLKLLTQLFGERATRRQRHRLLLDLRRQPADHAVDEERGRPRAGLVELAVRGQRRVRPRAAPGRRPAHQAGPRAADRAARRRRRRPRRRHPRRPAGARVRARRPAGAGGRAAPAPRRAVGPGRRRPAQRGRPPAAAQRVDRRRRRLGLRHRLRRARPRPGHRPRRQRARPGHRGLLQHRRAVVEVDSARRRGEVRRGRQDHGQEGPRPAGHRLRQRLRGAGGDGRRPAPDAHRVPGGRGLRRAEPHHRLQPLHRPRRSTCATGSTSSTGPSPPVTGRWCATTRRCGHAAATRSSWTPRARGSRWRTTSTASCGTRSCATAIPPRPTGCWCWPRRRSTSAGRPTRRWPPAARNASRLTPGSGTRTRESGRAMRARRARIVVDPVEKVAW